MGYINPPQAKPNRTAEHTHTQLLTDGMTVSYSKYSSNKEKNTHKHIYHGERQLSQWTTLDSIITNELMYISVNVSLTDCCKKYLPKRPNTLWKKLPLPQINDNKIKQSLKNIIFYF